MHILANEVVNLSRTCLLSNTFLLTYALTQVILVQVE